MKNLFKGNAKYIIPTLIIAFILVSALTFYNQPSVSAGTPPPDLPDIEGEPFSAVIDENMIVSREPLNVGPSNTGWTTVFEEDFEDGINSPPWLNISLNGGPYTWGSEAIANSLDISSTMVAWGVGTGAPNLDPQSDGYPNDVNSWLVAGPFDMSGAVDATVTFDLFLDSVPGVPGDPTKPGNTFAVAVSTDGSTYTGVQILDGGEAQWESLEQNLLSYVGEQEVWIAFIFKSDNQPNPDDKLGALLDNVVVSINNPSRVNMPYIVHGIDPTPIPPTPTPTPIPNPEGDYIDNFEFDIDGWSARRWSDGAQYEYGHRSDCDQGGRCGFLEAELKNNQAYTIISPLIPSKSPPYNIEVYARLMPTDDSDYPEDQAQYGIIFGGNWNGQECPNSEFSSCFTQYYELRVRFRDLGNDDRFLEYKLKRIDGHDSDNQNFGPDLIEWDKFGADVKKFVEWDITVDDDGDISVSANDKLLDSVDDSTFINNRYFGVEVRTGPDDESRVKFDLFKID